MNIYLEIFGYIGTILVVSSMMMKSINKLRIINVVGGTISLIYSALISAWPIVIMNAAIVLIHCYHFAKGAIKKCKSAINAQ